MKLCVVAIALVSVAGTAASGDIKTFSNDGFFDDASSWSPFGVPDADDRIVIEPGVTCTIREAEEVTSYTVDTIQVERDGNEIGRLVIDNGITLILENDDYNTGVTPTWPAWDNHEVSGEVRLLGNVDELATLKFTNEDHEIEGAGSIVGEAVIPTESRIPIIVVDNVTVTSFLDGSNQGIKGALEIRPGNSTSVLFNAGNLNTEEPTFGGIIVLEDGLSLEDTEDSQWITESCGPMIFKEEATGLAGDFVDTEGGSFDIRADVKTCGTFYFDCVSLVVQNGVDFQYATFSPDGMCTNPGSGGNDTCAQPYTVTNVEDECVPPPG